MPGSASWSPRDAAKPRRATMGRVVITGKGRRWLHTGHPWIFRDDVKEVDAENGDVVPVVDAGGAHQGWGTYSAHSRIALRMVTHGEPAPDDAFWRERVVRALRVREALGLAG